MKAHEALQRVVDQIACNVFLPPKACRADNGTHCHYLILSDKATAPQSRCCFALQFVSMSQSLTSCCRLTVHSARQSSKVRILLKGCVTGIASFCRSLVSSVQRFALWNRSRPWHW